MIALLFIAMIEKINISKRIISDTGVCAVLLIQCQLCMIVILKGNLSGMIKPILGFIPKCKRRWLQREENTRLTDTALKKHSRMRTRNDSGAF